MTVFLLKDVTFDEKITAIIRIFNNLEYPSSPKVRKKSYDLSAVAFMEIEHFAVKAISIQLLFRRKKKIDCSVNLYCKFLYGFYTLFLYFTFLYFYTVTTVFIRGST